VTSSGQYHIAEGGREGEAGFDLSLSECRGGLQCFLEHRWSLLASDPSRWGLCAFLGNHKTYRDSGDKESEDGQGTVSSEVNAKLIQL
jgi:hypothetical protein